MATYLHATTAPEHAQGEVKAAYWALFETTDLLEGEQPLGPGPELVAAVQARVDAFAQHYGSLYPAAVKCLLTDREQLTGYLRFPVEHRKRIRHFQLHQAHLRRDPPKGQGDRTAPPGEASCLSLVWAVLDRASRGCVPDHDRRGDQAAARPAPPTPRPTEPDPSPKTDTPTEDAATVGAVA